MRSLVDDSRLDFDWISRADESGIAYIFDLIRGDVLGHLCGQFEALSRQLRKYVLSSCERFDRIRLFDAEKVQAVSVVKPRGGRGE